MNRTKLLAMLMISAIFAAMVHGDEREPAEAGALLPDNVARDGSRLRLPIVTETSYADLVALFDDTADPAARRRR